MAASKNSRRASGGIKVPFSLWLVHIYQEGQYLRTIKSPFTESSANIFCETFNNGTRSPLAVARECQAVTTVPAVVE